MSSYFVIDKVLDLNFTPELNPLVLAVSLGRLKREFRIDKFLFRTLHVKDKTINVKILMVVQSPFSRGEVQKLLFETYTEIRSFKLTKDIPITAEQIMNYPKHVKEISKLIDAI